MLIKCPECELQVSDKAISCPHCGYPLKPSSKYQRKNSNKRRRLPNGFGQISEIKGRNLRNPFRAMVTIGKNDNGRPICKLLQPKAYFETYNDAYAALVDYNRNPYDPSPDVTLKELYERWSKKHFETLKNKSSIRAITSAWKYCSDIHCMNVSEIRIRHIKGSIDNAKIYVGTEEKIASPVMKRKMKSMFNSLFDYAVEYDLTDKNYARAFSLDKTITAKANDTKRNHIKFSNEEMITLWDNIDVVRYVDMIIVQCYSGWRPQELGLIELGDVNLEKWYFIGGMKTAAGTSRKVPIHSKIRHIIIKNHNKAIELGSKYLFNYTNEKRWNKSTFFSYDRFNSEFKSIRDKLNLNPDHLAHDGRKHFISMCKKYEVDQYAIKYMVGHSITDITEKIYTEREFSWLQEEIEKVK